MFRKTSLIIIALILVLNSGCRKKLDVQNFVMQKGDFTLSCAELDQEIAEQQKHIAAIEQRKKRRVVENTLVFLFAIQTFFTSLFFADFSDDNKKQIDLYKDRKAHLQDIKNLNKCNLTKYEISKYRLR